MCADEQHVASWGCSRLVALLSAQAPDRVVGGEALVSSEWDVWSCEQHVSAALFWEVINRAWNLWGMLALETL